MSSRVSLIFIAIVLSTCSDTVSPRVDAPLQLLNYTAPATVGVGGPLILRFKVGAERPIERVVVHWRATDSAEWHHIANAMAKDGHAVIRHQDLKTDRMQLRVQPADLSSEVLSAWITIDRSRYIQPIKIVLPTQDAIFSNVSTADNVIEWTVDPDFPVERTRISYRRESDSIWKYVDTVENSSMNRYVWLTPPKEPGSYFLRLQALGYTQPTEPVRISVTDTSGIHILEPMSGQMYYMAKSTTPVLRWKSELPWLIGSVDVEYSSNGATWYKLGTFDGSVLEIPLLPRLHYGSQYRVRIRRSGSTVWVESGEFFLVDFHVALLNGTSVMRRGSPWEIDISVNTSILPSCPEPYLDFFISSDRGTSWQEVDVYGDVVTIRSGPEYLLRMESTYGGITMSDTTTPFTVTDNLGPFFPALQGGTSFLFMNWNSQMAFGQVTITHSDTTEIQILSVSEEATRFVYSARSRELGGTWTSSIITEEKDGLHNMEGLPPGGPMYRYLDDQLQSHEFFIRTSCDPQYGYPRTAIRILYARGIGVSKKSSGTTYSPMSNNGSGCDFLRRW